ncbi:MAG: hypothetical protein B7X90_11295 [Novosphingobium sp. 17-62-19]|uniref:RipA family octameric membrane protein n=1 Tax=Novosphingobium sp. 17-62-19 TaxID=1970406 RepID=UPI000BDADE3A|nr:hypothetical protein [Novosphingobium sp. 17-62-19]OZA18707.1 MAG: hypothetical protein B7X90_11295 [Novosphingobium sp. 17-62-19]HQS97859.1 hypothetical protein [Novosphingobium sp.]
MSATHDQSPEVSQLYFNRLNLPSDTASPAHKAALDRSHELRKFEIENYWKRSAYFWGFQLVAFGALALSGKEGKFHPPVVLIVSVLGALAALTALLSAKGSKFWQKNWEAHVDFLEQQVEGSLHMTALMDGKVSFSVSRVNERFLEVLLAGWIIAFVAAALVISYPHLAELTPQDAGTVQIGIATLALVGGCTRLVVGQKSELRGRAYNRRTMKEWNGC